jgi:hypothetical protein
VPFIREDMADIRVSVADAGGTLHPYGDSWHSVEGGNLESDDAKVRPGGMGNEVSLGGPASRDDVTVSIPLTDVVVGWHKTLEQRVIEDAPTKVSYTFLNRLKQPITGATHTVTGRLKSAVIPDMDTGSSDAAMYEIIVSCDEVAA